MNSSFGALVQALGAVDCQGCDLRAGGDRMSPAPGCPVSRSDRLGQRPQLTLVRVGAFFLRPCRPGRRDASASAESPCDGSHESTYSVTRRTRPTSDPEIRAGPPAMNRPYDQHWLEFKRAFVCLPPRLLNHGSSAGTAPGVGSEFPSSASGEQFKSRQVGY